MVNLVSIPTLTYQLPKQLMHFSCFFIISSWAAFLLLLLSIVIDLLP